jgi:Tol biopolymer transport system component/uncharacterized membrane protein
MENNEFEGQGRVAVHLEETEFSVAPGSSTAIHVQIKNQALEDDTFGLVVDGIPTSWVSLPMPITPWSPGEAKEVTLELQPPPFPESQVGRYHMVIRVVSQNAPDQSAEVSCKLTIAALELEGEIGILMAASRFSVSPGSSITIPTVLINRGDADDSFELNLDGVPTSWISTPSPVTFLSPGEEQEVTISIQAPPVAETRAGRYPIKFRVSSQNKPELVSEVDATLTVAALEVEGRVGVLMVSTQYSVAPGGSVTIPIVLINQGLEEDTFKLGVEGIPVGWISTPSPFSMLASGEQREVSLTVQPPRSPDSRAGRHAFMIELESQKALDQSTQVECILTVGAYSEFTSELEPQRIEGDQFGMVTVTNQGNIQESYTLSFKSEEEALDFEPVQTQELRVPAGVVMSVEFRPKPKRRPLLGGEVMYPFSAQVASAGKEPRSHGGELITRALIPIWVIPVLIVLCLSLVCVSAFFITRRPNETTAATQTASANQTEAALIGEEDTDGDGLTNREEVEVGTDPFNPDSDDDELWDGPEVKQYGTDPLNPDTDGDSLTEGEEVLRRGTDPRNPDTDQDVLNDGDEVLRNTDPLNPDTDADGLGDGDEVQRGTDPLSPDTDVDKLLDGIEVQIGTDPLNPDTDNDRMIDGDETPPCPDPLNPDSDGDGIIDGLDLDPCDPVNPSLTASALPPTETQPAPTLIPTFVPTGIPTGQPTEVPPQPDLGIGTIAFSSNREGNFEIYSLNTQTFLVTRLTIEPAVDTQPAWSPDGSRIAFATNRDGDFEIYVMNADGTGLINVTNTPGVDDQYPTWSPDGGWIAFSSNRDGNQEVYKMRSNGAEVTNLSNNPAAEDYQPDWFSSGGIIFSEDRIAFTTNRDGNQEIYLMTVDGAEQVNLTLNPANDYSPAVSSDGSKIAFTSNRDGNQEVYSMESSGSNLINLTNNPAEDFSAAWSPNGQWIAFVTNRDGNREIYGMRFDGSQPFNLTVNPVEDNYPTWR